MNYIEYVTKYSKRKFDNETYIKHGGYSSRSDAQQERARLRTRHYKTRLVELPKSIRDTTVRWLVYARKMESE